MFSGPTLVGYRLHRPDGSQWDYQYEDIDTGEYYLTQQTTPEGDTVTYNYDGQDRLEWVQDASGNKTYLRYLHAILPTLVTRVDQTMQVGASEETHRSAHLNYLLPAKLRS